VETVTEETTASRVQDLLAAGVHVLLGDLGHEASLAKKTNIRVDVSQLAGQTENLKKRSFFFMRGWL
jgi:hypothetical protein